MAAPVFLVFGVLCSASAGPDATSQIKREIERLQQSLKDKPITDSDFPNIAAMLAEGLKGASEALGAGPIYLSLEMLGRESDLYSGARAATDGKAEVVEGGLSVIFQDIVHSNGTREADCAEQSGFRGATEWTFTRMPDLRLAVERLCSNPFC